MNKNFKVGMKVYLNGEYGLVVNSDCDTAEVFGMIRWDNPKESDYEDWRGLFSSFIEIGGKILRNSHQFEFINDDGTLK